MGTLQRPAIGRPHRALADLRGDGAEPLHALEPQSPDAARSEDGFALIAAIWAVGLLALLFATYTAAARYRAIEAHSLARHAQAEALADAGLNLAVVDLLAGLPAARGGARYGRAGQVFACGFEGGRLALSIADERGKVDLNAAPPELIEALLRAVEPSRGGAVARSILETRAAHRARLGAAAAQAQPTFRSALELARIEGVDERVLAGLVPLMTVHSASAGIDPEVAPLALLAALSPRAALGAEAGRLGLPAGLAARSSGRIFLVSVDAAASGARVSLEAVVEIAPDSAAPYRVLERRRGAFRPSAETAPRAAAC